MLNGARLNTRSLNVGVRPIAVALAGDTISNILADGSFRRTHRASGEAVAAWDAQFIGGNMRFFEGAVHTTLITDFSSSVRRISWGEGVVNVAASLYYTRTINWTGAALTSILAVSDVGVVYGEGSSVMLPMAALDGTRAKVGFSDAIALTLGEFQASAIRRPLTSDNGAISPLAAALDSAHISGGIRYIDGFADAYAYLDVVDAGMKRQVIIGSAELLFGSSASGRAVRNATGVGTMVTLTSGDFGAIRRAEGSGVIALGGDMQGLVLVPGDMPAIIHLNASMTGYVYRRTTLMQAITEAAVDLTLVRTKLGAGDAPLVALISLDGRRTAMGAGEAVAILNAESTATDYNFTGEDDEAEVFFRPASTREFSRPAAIREWRRA